MIIIGIDIGGTKCAVSRLNAAGQVEETHRFPTPPRDAALSRLRECVASLAPIEDPLFGISCGGPLDARRGVILSPPNLPGWDYVEITKFFTDHFGGRAVLMNDANASALAEWRFGAGRGSRHMLFLTAGTGMGGGFVLDGRLYEGATGDAGEVGHIRLTPQGPVGFNKAGSFEGYCSGSGLVRLAEIMATAHPGGPPAWYKAGAVSAKTIADAAATGEPLSCRIMQESGRRFGEGLAILIDVLNPEVIVIGGIFPRCGSLLRPAMTEALEREALPHALAACRIVPAELGEQIGSYAAIAAALHEAPRHDSNNPTRRSRNQERGEMTDV